MVEGHLGQGGNGSEGGDPPGGVTRRRFVHGAVKAGAVAGTVAWVAPQLSSVALAQDAAGSGPPTPTVRPGNVVRPTPVATPPGPPGAPASPPGAAAADPGAGVGGTLPATGFNARRLTIVGGAAVVVGRALVTVSRRGLGLRRPPAVPTAGPDDLAAE